MAEETAVSEAPLKAVVGVDGSEDGMAALRRAKRIGAAMHAELHVVHVRHEPYWWSFADLAPVGAESQFRQILDGVATEVETAVKAEMSSYPERWSFQVRSGNPAEQLLAVSDEVGAVAIAVGARGHRPMSPYLLGSVSTALLHRAPVSVLVVRGADPEA
ncbi:MAG TPA: universal stress protein [Streptosporangiaceae bacterium]|nr:universal stress protein [Streptosporangiaceae bacterium]